jgi:hypothetical protein
MFPYDTTFDVGDLYMSVLILKHALLKRTDKEAPTIPIAFFFHDPKIS